MVGTRSRAGFRCALPEHCTGVGYYYQFAIPYDGQAYIDIDVMSAGDGYRMEYWTQ